MENLPKSILLFCYLGEFQEKCDSCRRL